MQQAGSKDYANKKIQDCRYTARIIFLGACKTRGSKGKFYKIDYANEWISPKSVTNCSNACCCSLRLRILKIDEG